MISALHSCWNNEDSKSVKSLHQVYVAIATCSGGLACLDLNFKCNIHKNVINSDKWEIMNEFTLSNCSPRRILSWQAYSAVIAADFVQSDKLGSQCILVTLSADGVLRFRNISLNASSTGQHKNDEILKTGCTTEDSSFDGITENPLIDLIISDETPSHIAIQPRLDRSTSTITRSLTDDICWIHIACGYPNSGLIRVFCPSNTRMLKELDYHKGYDITGLLYSPCGLYLYTSDTSGQLAVWRIVVDTGEKLYEMQLVHSLSHQVGIFSRMKPTITNQGNKIDLMEIKQSIITTCSKGFDIAYFGPQVGIVTIAKAANLSTMVQIDLCRLILKYFPKYETIQKFDDVSQFMKSFHFIQFISQNNEKDEINHQHLFVCTSRGYLFKFNVLNGKPISCAEFSIVSNSNSKIYISTMKISPNGKTLLLSETSSPFIYIASTNLYPLYDDNDHIKTVHNPLNRSIVYQKFIGHIYPIDNFYFTFDEKYCISIDRGCWSCNPSSTYDDLHTTNKEMKASSIFIWKLQEIETLCELKVEQTENKENVTIDELQMVKYSASLQPSSSSFECGDKHPVEETETRVVCDPSGITHNNCETERENYIYDTHRPLSHRHWTVYSNDQYTLREFNPDIIQELKFVSVANDLLKGLFGFGSFNRMIDNLIWDSDTGLFIYTNESLLVFEELETGVQSAYRSIMPNTSIYVKHFSGEIFNSIELTPNKSTLAIGSTSYWHLNNAYSCTDIISTLIIIPIKFNHHDTYRHLKQTPSLSQIPVLKCDLQKRFLLPNNNKYVDQMINSYPTMKNSYPYGILLTMSFTMDSRYLITIEDYHTNGIKLWSTQNWTVLSSVNVDGYFNQILCSSLFGNEFITIGGHLSYVDNNVGKSVNRENLILFWKIDVKHSKYTDFNHHNDNRNSDRNLLNSENVLTFTKG
ncbi:unnamed protein product [Heterobilharzia americana]|nr:unnamed protein product [Heterobilharzia americana]